jgi:NADPH:quinone reductase-like Zn-dependent oxidoreductase
VSDVERRQAAGALLPPVDHVFGFEQAIDAHRHMLGGTQVGKVGVSIED